MISDELKQRIEATIGKDRIMLFMKGVPTMPQCGFSAAVVSMLRDIGQPFGSYNILTDPALREGLKEYSSWPTYPQLYVDGKLVGGADIVRELHTRGQLAGVLKGEPPTEA